MLRIIKVLFIFSLAAAIAWALQYLNPHDFGDKCYDCHVGLKNPDILTRDADILCLKCHPKQKKMTHPTGFFPAKTKNIPPGFPLYNGKMMCITCHIAHKTYDETDVQHRKFDNNPYMLRYDKTGKIFCYQCHYGDPDNFIVRKADSHALGLGRAHDLSHDVSLKDVLDDGSRECLSCHDGTLSQDASISFGGISWEHSKGVGVAHPIGIDYKRVYSKKPMEYRHSSSIDSRVRLFDGKIGCQTCHNHYSKNPHLLVMKNKRSALCLQCHDL